ncbi:MAG: protein-ADP-ribose hydrolase [Synergistaceae bacterium]|jgi:O-acetyl-ADP-ribose deacetylase (regulator of RNase III)|nr:protein-ADP-ribose hydrolase [Synergistaceae bacterium]
MEQEHRLIYLLDYLLGERGEHDTVGIPEDYADKRDLFRTLVNVRSPYPIHSDFIRVQDDFLREESKQKGIVRLNDIPTIEANNRISLWEGDITRLAACAVVNAANAKMLGCFIPGHNCIDNVIHTFAGVQLRLECAAIMEKQGYPEPAGQAKLTSAYNLPSDFVLHTVGPIVDGQVTDEDKRLLASCYHSCLETACENNIESIAFCCISTGVFHFPKEEAALIAIDTVFAFLKSGGDFKRIIFVVFTENDEGIYKKSKKIISAYSASKRWF